MNVPDSAELIAEVELRAALRPMRPDRDTFEDSVRQKLHGKIEQYDTPHAADLSESAWLRIAASVIPLQLFGKGAVVQGAGSTLGKISLGQLTFGQKIIAVLSLPAVSLMLMLSATVWAALRIRTAQRNQSPGLVDPMQLLEMNKQWWRHYGAASVLMISAVVLPLFSGLVIPVGALFLVSGILVVAMILRLGRERLIDRSTIAANLASMLMILGQLASSVTFVLGNGTPLLDQRLIGATLFLGASLVLAGNAFPKLSTSPRAGQLWWGLFTALIPLPLVVWFSSSLWRPVSTRVLVEYVESFDEAKFSSASWSNWSIPAEWLHDSGAQVNLAKPRRLLSTAIEKRDTVFGSIFVSAYNGGLVEPENAARVLAPHEARRRLNSADKLNTGSLARYPTAIYVLVATGTLNNDERDLISDQLLVEMEELKAGSANGNRIERALELTKLSQSIDRPFGVKLQRPWIHRTLVESQWLGSHWARRRGGFSPYAELAFADPHTTVQAIELMEIYGVPKEVDLLALRSYLRPNGLEATGSLLSQACIRAASLQRLESLPGVPPLGWRDYLYHEQNLLMAVAIVLLCTIATYGSPQLQRVTTGPARQLPL
ncbi:MAG: hypothetical protein KDB22_10500 [Planctomycetales bacterium]|nr:hypothetical protein [Planctomycetales bacterium]